MDIPMTEVATTYGRFYAQALDGDTVRFRTKGPNPDDSQQPLKLNRLCYTSEVDLTRQEGKRSGGHLVDEVWRGDLSDASYRLRRFPDGGPATINAQATLRNDVMPQLAAWLGTPDGVRLLDAGADTDRARSVDQADLALLVLGRAMDRVEATRQSLELETTSARSTNSSSAS